jgi:serine/threonine-protein kinase RsbW
MPERRLTIPGRFERIQDVCDFVCRAAEEAGMDDREVFHCQLAVDEACTNIIEHGYGGEDRGPIEAICDARDGELVIILKDTGAPFDPTTVPEPGPYKSIEDAGVGGHGLYFMRRVMDTVNFDCAPNGNTLVMTKRKGS